MNVFGIKIDKKDDFTKIKNNYFEIQKKLNNWQKIKPYAEDRYKNVSTDENVLIPIYPLEEETLYSLALNSDVLRTGLNAIRDGIFRRGLKIEAKKDSPDPMQEKILNSMIKNCNNNSQGIIDVCKQLEFDMNVLDISYIIILKDYYYDSGGRIIDKITKPREIIRGSPLRIRIISDFQGNLGVREDGTKLYVSPEDRALIYTEAQAQSFNFICPKNKKELRQVFFRGEIDNGKYVYYFKDEIIPSSKHNPSLIYGYPPILSIWMKVVTLMQMDRFLMTAYQKGRPPRGLLLIGTTNYASLMKTWELLKSETRKDPHSITPLAYETNQSGKGSAQWIDLMRPLTEMEYIESRNEMRRQILAIYGLMPMFGGDVTTSGGLNQESQQIAVTNRALEQGQKIYNDKIFPWILNQLGITDYTLRLKEPEERDETEDAKRLGIKIDNALKMKQMGFDVEWDEKEEIFTFSQHAVESMQNQQFLPQQNIYNQNQLAGMPNKADIKKEDLLEITEEIKKHDQIADILIFLEKEKSFIKKEDKNIEINKLTMQQFAEQIRESIWRKKFDGINAVNSNKIKDIIIEGIAKNITLEELTDKIVKIGIEEKQAEAIARTEQQALQNSAREIMFKEIDPKEEYKYKWVSIPDSRRSEICKEITELTKKGVSMKKLKNIIKEVAAKYNSEAREFTPHVNCRSTISIHRD